MNKTVTRLVLTGFLSMILLAGCAISSPQITYYSLYAPAPTAAPVIAPAGSPPAVSVGPVVIPDILKQAQIATGGADGRYQLSEYHRWSGEVDRDFARAVAEQLAGRLGTEQVAIFPWDQHFTPTCRVLIDVLSMGGAPGVEATLAVRWSLVDPQGQKPAQIRRTDLREAPAAVGYPAWVAAQQRNIAKLGQEIAGELQRFANP
jgi:uncharacterized lipoprotein YmbA